MHLFYIHSHITYIIAKSHIAKEGLMENNISFILSRSYMLDDRSSSNSLDISTLYDYLENSKRANKIFHLKKRLKQVDQKISKLTNKSCFTLYVPQFNHSIFQMLASHELCESTVLMEEGITSYKKDKALYLPTNSYLKKILSLVFTRRFIQGNSHYFPFPRNKFQAAICIDRSCFPYLDDSKKIIVSLKEVEFLEYIPKVPDNAVLFLLDSFKERTALDSETYFNIVGATLRLVEHSNHRLYIKFHPEQGPDIINQTLKFIEVQFGFSKIVELKKDCILELEFIIHKHLIVLGMHTSLLYYARQTGHKVLSSIRTTSKIPVVNTYIDHIMDKEQKDKYLGYE